jgi:hypothetical protein
VVAQREREGVAVTAIPSRSRRLRAGEKVAERLSANKLTVGFAVLLVAVAAYVGSRAALALT